MNSNLGYCLENVRVFQNLLSNDQVTQSTASAFAAALLQPAPELKKEFFDKIDHLYDSEEAIKKDDEHVAEIPPKIDFEENEKVEKRDEGDDKSTENLDDQV